MTTYFNILSKNSQDGQFHYCVRLNPDCEVFKGHFPGEPIAPGMCNVQLILDCLQDAKNQPITIKSISRLKFLNLIRPDNQLLDVEIKLTDDKVSATISQSNVVALQLIAKI